MIRIGDVSGRDGLSFFRAHFGYYQRLGAGRKVGVVSSAPSPFSLRPHPFPRQAPWTERGPSVFHQLLFYTYGSKR